MSSLSYLIFSTSYIRDLEDVVCEIGRTKLVITNIPRDERIFVFADLNGHVGEGNAGDEEVMGKYGLGARNYEGEMAVKFATRFGMAFLITYFKKKREHQTTYKSGGNKSQVDYVLCRRDNLREVSDCKCCMVTVRSSNIEW